MKNLVIKSLLLGFIYNMSVFGGGFTIENTTPDIVEIQDVEHWCNEWSHLIIRTNCLDYRNNAYTREILPGKKIIVDKGLVWRTVSLANGEKYYFEGQKEGEKFESVHIPDSEHWTLKIKEHNRKGK